MKSGASISGKILYSDNDKTIVDLGADILKISSTDIHKIIREDTDYDTVSFDSESLYYCRETGISSIVEASRKYADAIVIVRSPGGMGSGFFINARGYLLTNFHVIEGQKNISVTRFLKKKDILERVVYSKIKIIGIDSFNDLALLKIDETIGDTITHTVFKEADSVKYGEKIFVIGNPLGLERSVAEGIISQTSRNFGGKIYLQIDAPVNPGNSGGPLFNESGQVIGVVNMGIIYMQGLNFAIPASQVKFMLDNIETFSYNQANSESGFLYPEPPRKNKIEVKND
ncbi:MAG TPA: S1C family serine protease [bacterium]|nr:S1C family serine protease [bacterium]HPN29546.1 S1C family serine protease [bacterium]